ncbi:SCP-2 sterol transfer family protein [Herbihabitans rhizosphaerae]|uniref:SCP-2 sterol transfer family protein n=1 Tax=Herbihabitans rhizosphaerae TaxID=1872711 RepID=A0A4Q7KML1_9PSEU|nr:SCP-2 sterol transfer family protein [Herbihabitans rhizosphaerae]
MPELDAFARRIDFSKLSTKQFVQLLDALDMLGKTGAGFELSTMRTETFVWIISQASTEQLDALMAKPNLRHVVFSEIFRRMSDHVRPESGTNEQVVVHWRFSGGTGDDGFDRFQTVIDKGSCKSTMIQDLDPRATLTLTPVDFLKVATGNVNATLLFVKGRVKVRGDIPFAAKFADYFDLPHP